MASIIYNRFFYNMADALVDWTADTIKVALLTSTYTPTRSHALWSSVSTYQTSGTGYTSPGRTATTKTRTSGTTTTLDMADTTWASSTITARYAVLHNVQSGRSGLICCFEFTENKSSSSGNFTLQWNASGVMTLQQS